MKSVISYGKLRGSFGTSGQDGIGDYQYLDLYSSGAVNSLIKYQGISSLANEGAVNPFYSWEQVKKLELGLELGFFQDRLFFSSSVWRNRSSNQLGNLPLPATAGRATIVANRDAKIQNLGLDFIVSTRNISGKAVKWSTSLNLGIARNKLLSLPEGFGGGINGFNSPYNNLGGSFDPLRGIGKPFFNVQYAYQSMGVNPSNGLYQFLDKDGHITTASFNAIINKIVDINPKYSGGINNSINFKGLTLDIFIQFKKQTGKNYLFQGSFLPGGYGQNDIGNLPRAFLDYWKSPSDISSFQKLTTQSFGPVIDQLNTASNSDLAYKDASFIKVKNISISHKFSQLSAKKVGFQSLTVYVNGQNMWTISGYKGVDPDIQDVFSLPSLSTVTAGISLGL